MTVWTCFGITLGSDGGGFHVCGYMVCCIFSLGNGWARSPRVGEGVAVGESIKASLFPSTFIPSATSLCLINHLFLPLQLHIKSVLKQVFLHQHEEHHRSPDSGVRCISRKLEPSRCMQR
jgi:hypothetical protein